MSIQKIISDLEMERGHNRVLGETFTNRMTEIKRRLTEEIDALMDEFKAEVQARDAALDRLIKGDAPDA